MNSLSTVHDSADDQGASAPGSANAGTGAEAGSVSASSDDDRNPLWLIAGAMALFFAVTAAFLAAG